MKTVINDNHTLVPHALKRAYNLWQAPSFLDTLARPTESERSAVGTKHIAELLATSSLVLRWRYSTKLHSMPFRYKKTLADLPNTKFLQLNKMNREGGNIAATPIHEVIPVRDQGSLLYAVGHGLDSAMGKERIALYWIGTFPDIKLKNTPTTVCQTLTRRKKRTQVPVPKAEQNTGEPVCLS